MLDMELTSSNHNGTILELYKNNELFNIIPNFM